jgi:hypothetical protein
VSLILEALKKLEREKQSPDRGGFLVLGATSWPSAPSRGHRLALTIVAGALCALVAGALAWRSRQSATAPNAAIAEPRPGVGAIATPGAPFAASPWRPSISEATTPNAVRVEEAAVLPERGAPREPEAAAPGAPPLSATPASARPAPVRFQLQAISRRDGRAVAVLNDRLVYEGDSFDGATVIRIGEAEASFHRPARAGFWCGAVAATSRGACPSAHVSGGRFERSCEARQAVACAPGAARAGA